MTKITGTFAVTLTPMESFATGQEGLKLGRLSIEKTFAGALNAESRGEMFSAITTTPGSAGYVAVEQVQGELDGRVGSFALQHFGMMNRGESRLILEVIPDSGTGELTGLTGQMQIRNENGQHFYDFEYHL
jgi:hypothetical protein